MPHVSLRASGRSRLVFPHAGAFVLGAVLGLGGASSARAAWDVKPDPPAEPVQFSVKPGMAILLPNPTGMSAVFPTTPSAFVAVGQNTAANDTREVWDLRTFQRTGTIRGKIDAAVTGPFRLSPDGQFLAAMVNENQPERAIEVWSFADGKRVQRVEPKPRPKKIIAFDFLPEGRLVVVQETELGKVLQTYDVKANKVLLHQALPAKFQDGSLGLSPGRKYAAFMAGKELHVVELDKGTSAGKLPYDGLASALVFSPDGTELAGMFFNPPGMRLVVWDLAKAEVVVEHRLPSAEKFPAPGWADGDGQRHIDWLPDGSAWLLSGHALVNRKDGRWVWSLFGPPYRDPRDKNAAFKTDGFLYAQSVKLLDNDHAIVGLRGNGAPAHLEVVKLPWPQIDASLKAVESGASALMGPGAAISLKFYMGAVRFSTPDQTQAELAEAISATLAAQGIKVADGQPVVLHVRHEEVAGPPYKIVGPGLRPTGQSVTSTNFTTELSLTAGGKASPVWYDKKVATGLGQFTTSHKTGNRTDEEAMRLGGFEGLKESLKAIGLPYFIPRPEDKNLAMLPGVTELKSSATAANLGAKNAKTVKATTRGQATGTGKK